MCIRDRLEGLADAPERSEDLRARLRTKAQLHGSDYLHRALVRLDPENAAGIGPRDTQKVIRAIEMRILTGKPVREIHRAEMCIRDRCVACTRGIGRRTT